MPFHMPTNIIFKMLIRFKIEQNINVHFKSCMTRHYYHIHVIHCLFNHHPHIPKLLLLPLQIYNFDFASFKTYKKFKCEVGSFTLSIDEKYIRRMTHTHCLKVFKLKIVSLPYIS